MSSWRDIPGWWSEQCAEFYRKCVEEAPPNAHFVEVGCWMGRSAASMASAINALGRGDIRFDCVDTWKGTPAEGDAGHHQRLIQEGGVNLREEFENNLRALGLRGYVNPVEGDSSEVAQNYRDRSLDLVMIDGDHRKEMVKRDCLAWLPKLRYGGILAGDDGNAAQVISGVREAGIEPEVNGRIWSWRKRLPVNVNQGCSVLTAGPLNGGEELADWFGGDILGDARSVLTRYYQHSESGLRIEDCNGPNLVGNGLVLCPCDNHDRFEEPWLRRSTCDLEPTFPAFPHGDWPFLGKSWVSTGNKEKISIGFCGIDRPEIRKAALEAAGSLPHQFLIRRSYMAKELPKEQSRAEYLGVLLGNPFQLCVRGAGNYCYRLYETLAAGRVPVLVDTNRSLPWSDVLPWEQMAVIVPAGNVERLPEYVESWFEDYSATAVGRANRHLWWDYLSPVGWWREWARRR